MLQVKRLKEERQELDLALKKERRAALSAKARPLPTAALVIACASCRTHLVDALTLGAVSCVCACLVQLATTVSDTEVTMCANEQVSSACVAEVGQACRGDPSGSHTPHRRG